MALSHSLIAGVILLFCIIACSLQPALCSYLDAPRINFAGQFRVDTNGINNNHCNFRMDRDVEYTYPPQFHDYGTNSFKFYNTKVSGVVNDVNGNLDPSDSLVDNNNNIEIVTNIEKPFTKLVDLDVDCQMHSTLYGMYFGIAESGQDGYKLLFYGKWTPCIIANDLWPQLTCFSDKQCLLKYSPSGESFSAQSTTTLTEIEWTTDEELIKKYPFLDKFKQKAKKADNTLAIRISQHAYKYGGVSAGLGWVEGAIGIPSEDDALCIPGNRKMYPVKNSKPAGLSYKICGTCKYKGHDAHQGRDWVGSTPFQVNFQDDKNAYVMVDLSISLVMDNDQNTREIGMLELHVFDDTARTKIDVFADYAKKDTYLKKSGIYTFHVTDTNIISLMKSNPLGVVQVSKTNMPVVLLKEHKYFIRPKSYYVGRLDSMEKTHEDQKVLITSYGKPVNGAIKLTVNSMLNPELRIPMPTIPPNGVVAKYNQDYDKKTGVATFTFKKGASIPAVRVYGQPMCPGDDRVTIPIDGQVYFFYYGIEGEEDSVFEDIQTVYLVHSDVRFKRPYAWVQNVGPILTQYARLTPMMKTILDLSNYGDVTKPHNINLLKKNLKLDFHDPGYMPTTRNLSPVKRKMILEWLDNPIYEYQCKFPVLLANEAKKRESRSNYHETDFTYPTCHGIKTDPVTNEVRITDPHFNSAFDVTEQQKCASLGLNFQYVDQQLQISQNLTTLEIDVPEDRPLLSNLYVAQKSDPCTSPTKGKLVKQLQTALKLEWATIPVYLTTLYSIADGCSIEIYNLIREVVMQEMLHFVLVGNILISLGEVPEIDSPKFAPKYPGYLPGCVLPGLKVKLEKLSLKHIHDVLMMIELPSQTEVNHKHVFTIGKFYDEIKCSIKNLADESIFDSPSVDYQVMWEHWDANSKIGHLRPIKSAEDALAAIETIVSQGEGASTMNPKDIADRTYAHFFKFEEIYCGRHLEQISENQYDYTGGVIFFDPLGIAPMRPNPSTKEVPQDSVCFTETRVFHAAYRNFLRKLQEVFNGNPKDKLKPKGKPGDILIAVELMEALQMNAKRLMWIDYDGYDTCGPVWDYNFE